ncbi:major facilitator superfamily domain-containing protein [Lasiosphaeris hirsuta]|uniref:Major facilitator superfamily domain-containing protein n=1 Tax=Lasiosphaeris hirsuta TaxID=260670 RepID=A0AA40DTW8_9PEZI|nr:major facilitator superfamily domain-containing protein [Lasiosphaeris hirsuta]
MKTGDKQIGAVDGILPTPTPSHSAVVNDVDGAWEFLDKHRNENIQDESVDILAIRRKNDYRIVPLGFLLYTMQFMDKLVLNYAGVMTLREDLNLKGNDFSNLVTATYVAIAVWEIPTVYFLQRFPAAKYMAINAILWGISTACGAAAHNYQTLLVTRIFLGIFEATINPSLMLISGRWYTKPEQAPRFSFWLLGLGVGQIVGGAISYGFQLVSPTLPLQGWRIMFILLGLVTIVFGGLTFWYMPDTPMEAPWLTDREKVALLKHISINQTGVENRKVRVAEILEALRDPQVWLIWLSVTLFAGTGGITIAYSSTLIRNLGYTSKQATLLNMPAGLISITVMLIPGWAVRRGHHRWAWALGTLFPAIIGSALMSFLPSTNTSGILAGIYLANFIPGPLTIFWNWAPANIAGATKRAFVSALLGGLFAAGGIIGPQSFQARDAPEYRPAKITVLATQAAGACTTFALFLYYVRQNRKRNLNTVDRETEEAFMSPEVWARLTDRENMRFRYSY